MAFANERQWDLRDCSSLCNTCKQKEKKKWHFHPLLNLRLTPIFLSGHNSGKMHKCEGPLVSPKVTVHSATVNNSKNVASAKVNIFYSDIPSAWWHAMVPSYWGTSGTRALLGGQPRPIERRSSSGPSECLDPSALSGVPVLLVTHEGPVVAQDVHGVLPVPARAAVVLEAGLGVNRQWLSNL